MLEFWILGEPAVCTTTAVSSMEGDAYLGLHAVGDAGQAADLIGHLHRGVQGELSER